MSIQATPLEDFFSRYQSQTFDYEPENPVKDEFDRLCLSQGIAKRSQEGRQIMDEFREALVMEFNELYGVDVNEFESWERICEDIGIKPVPDTMEECRRVSVTFKSRLTTAMREFDIATRKS